MGQILRPNKLKNLEIVDATTIRLPAGSLYSIGSRQFYNDSDLNCDFATNGLGGLDVGSVASDSRYYLYAVLSGGVVGIVASLSALSPAGFIVFENIGEARTDSLSDIEYVFNAGDDITFWQKKLCTSNRTSVGEDITEMNLTGLTIGKQYKLTISMECQVISNSACGLYYDDNSIQLCMNIVRDISSSGEYVMKGSEVIIPTTTTLVAKFFTNGGGSRTLISTNNRTWGMIEELPKHRQTSKF